MQTAQTASPVVSAVGISATMVEFEYVICWLKLSGRVRASSRSKLVSIRQLEKGLDAMI